MRGWCQDTSSRTSAPSGPGVRAVRRRLHPRSGAAPHRPLSCPPASSRRPHLERPPHAGDAAWRRPPPTRCVPPAQNAHGCQDCESVTSVARGREARASTRCQPRRSPGNHVGEGPFRPGTPSTPRAAGPAWDREGGLGQRVDPKASGAALNQPKKTWKIPTWRRPRANEPSEWFQGLSPSSYLPTPLLGLSNYEIVTSPIY